MYVSGLGYEDLENRYHNCGTAKESCGLACSCSTCTYRIDPDPSVTRDGRWLASFCQHERKAR